MTTGVALESSSFVMDSAGRRVTGNVTIELMPGIGVGGPNGEHMDRENGPHTVPVAFAAPLLSSKRARLVEARAPLRSARVGAGAAQVKGAPAGVQQRDPVATTREGRGRR